MASVDKNTDILELPWEFITIMRVTNEPSENLLVYCTLNINNGIAILNTSCEDKCHVYDVTNILHEYADDILNFKNILQSIMSDPTHEEWKFMVRLDK
jgi:hypothetical protein